MRVSVLSLGCKVNQAESLSIEADLRSIGWSVVNLKENPDFCVINTCSVTGSSDYQSRQLIRRAGNACSNVIVTGCYSELNRDFVSAMHGVTAVVSNSEKSNIAGMLSGLTSSNRLYLNSSSRSRHFIKVQDGCNNSCSYCVIPQARGHSRSVPVEDILKQVDAASATFNEVVLTGIHLGSYGYDLKPQVTLSELISICLHSTPVRRIRLSSLEVTEIDKEMLEILSDKRICKHLHIPLQSGDDRILKKMGRNYLTTDYSCKINQIQEVLPGVCIGTDVIVGYPGETEEEFQNTFELLQSLPISYIHVFPYSPRSGTKAAQLKAEADPLTIKERCAAVRGLSQAKKAAYMRSQVGETLDLLVEKVEDEHSVIGTTGNYLKARAISSGLSKKALVSVRVAAVDR
ncbi:MAG TPA: tRNA (N(6)-L-threonylcarbamoyladenosine(37)-C(2))-methylthiotransferase MtaB, partial [Thermodesulfovibrionales bacterium]|nr:tRNA (N(6)-L-threonylcarbamoyladenosine(37)-C(2))-methylthiotransferase MtaB [Thermodesulfovibrionales bacterium]